MPFDFSFVLLHISALLSLMLLFFILKMKNKTQLHYSFLSIIFLQCIWTLGHIFEVYSVMANSNITNFFVYFCYFGLIFIPTSILLTGIIYLNTKIKISFSIIVIFIFPVIDYLMLLTNDYHKLYFVKYSIYNNLVEYGSFFYIHTIASYIYILLGIGLLLYSTTKSSGFFSRQSSTILTGVLIPLVVNILLTLRIITLPVYSTAITFSFAVLCFALAIFRYNFLSAAPIALQTVVDRISDSFVVINEDYQIIDFNRTMAMTFKDIVTIYRNKNLFRFLEGTSLMDHDKKLMELIEKARKAEKSISFEKHIQENQFDKYFSIEITPIISNRNFLGTIILFKDITENVKNIATIEEKHAIMMEQERLASLGQLMGGIAHNLKTPIMSIAGAVEGLRDLVKEYEESVGESSVTVEDHQEIASEMRSWLDKIRPYCTYMSDIIDTVKGQAMQFNTNSLLRFTVGELVKRIELLMKFELIRYNCTMKTVIQVNDHTEISGDVNSLVQVFDNIIVNAIQAYDRKHGLIDFVIADNKESILFTIRDYAKGIPEPIKSKLLKEMITTKGKNGTGLGLYMSYSTIKGRFGGKMWFDSVEGKGTSFYIQLPHVQ